MRRGGCSLDVRGEMVTVGGVFVMVVCVSTVVVPAGRAFAAAAGLGSSLKRLNVMSTSRAKYQPRSLAQCQKGPTSARSAAKGNRISMGITRRLKRTQTCVRAETTTRESMQDSFQCADPVK